MSKLGTRMRGNTLDRYFGHAIQGINYENVIIKFLERFRDGTRLTTIMKTKALLATIIGVGLSLSANAQPGKYPGETVELTSLPASVQQTIKQKAGGGEVVRVIREDDPDGKWNYEVIVRNGAEESAFEVSPKGAFVKQHTEARK